MSSGLLAFLFAVVLVGALILVLASAKRNRSHGKLDHAHYAKAWEKIESSLEKGNNPSYHLAVLNADKLLDQALRERGFRGETMGERMKSAHYIWKNSNAVWTAHKIRNKVAHEPNVELSFDLTKQSMATFRRALHDVGALE